ncbi:unnamed protein product, partial [Sphagnum balticum]
CKCQSYPNHKDLLSPWQELHEFLKDLTDWEQTDAIKPALEEKKEDCAHNFTTTLDFGRWCTICGMVVEHVKDMVFMWHKP